MYFTKFNNYCNIHEDFILGRKERERERERENKRVYTTPSIIAKDFRLFLLAVELVENNYTVYYWSEMKV